jgi:hypothetical protein
MQSSSEKRRTAEFAGERPPPTGHVYVLALKLYAEITAGGIAGQRTRFEKNDCGRISMRSVPAERAGAGARAGTLQCDDFE